MPTELSKHEMTKRLVEGLLRSIERTPNDMPLREGLTDTPSRVARSFDTIYGGYAVDVKELLTTFSADDILSSQPKGTEAGIVSLCDIEFYSTCEHHMLPFYGKAHVAYIPRDTVVGISKLARVLDAYARRLQVQERLAEDVVSALMEHLNPHGAAVYIEARHHCICSRGVQKQTSTMVYTALRGAFLENPASRAELFSILFNKRG